MATLRILDGPGEGGQILLGTGSHVIGADELACDVVLHDDQVLQRHLVMTVLDDDTVCIEVPEGSQAMLGARVVGPGEYLLDPSSELRIGGTRILCRQQQKRKKSPPDREVAPELTDEVRSAPAKRRGGSAAWLAGVVCVSISGFLLVANGSTPTVPDPVQMVKAALVGLGRPDLVVGKNSNADGVIVTGFARDAGERKELELALSRGTLPAVTWQLSSPGQVRQFDPVIVQGGGNPLHLDGNTLLLDAPPKSSSGAPPGASSVVELHISAFHVDDTEVPFFETANGERFELGAMLPGGYKLISLTKEAIVLARGGDRIIYTLQ